MAFKTQAEIFKALLDGVKIKKEGWLLQKYMHLKDGDLFYDNGLKRNQPVDFSNLESWSIYEEPKPKKKVTLYRYTYREDNGPDIGQTSWCSYGFKEGWSHHFTLLKTESKEVEYDDV